ncbi:hypothetical protein MOSE0_B03004 [Monosporozyma servazzii]
MSEDNNSPSVDQYMLDNIKDVSIEEFLGKDKEDQKSSPKDTVSMLLKQHDKLGIVLIEQISQNKILIQQNKDLLAKVKTLEKSDHNSKEFNSADLLEMFKKNVGIYSGGKTNDPDVKFKKWKNSVIRFREDYRNFIPDNKLMITLIKSRLHDEAYTWFEANEDTFNSETDVFDGIEKRFGSNNPFWEFALRLYPYELPSDNKSIKDIGEEFQALVDVAPKGVNMEFLTLSFFSRLPLAIRGLVVNRNFPQNTSWTTLLDFAINLEPFYIKAIGKRHEITDGEVTKLSSNKKRKKAPRCSLCDQEGHYSNRCPDRES